MFERRTPPVERVSGVAPRLHDGELFLLLDRDRCHAVQRAEARKRDDAMPPVDLDGIVTRLLNAMREDAAAFDPAARPGVAVV
jgi:hypothetical protein